MTDKPKCQLTGINGNVFALLGVCNQALRKAGQGDKCQELNKKVFGSHSYDQAFGIMQEYVEVS